MISRDPSIAPAGFKACSIAVWLIYSAVAAAAPQLTAGEAQVLSGRSTDNQHASVAANADGTRTFVAWDGQVAGERRILFRERVHDVWLPELVLDAKPGSFAPEVEVDAFGSVHIAWIAPRGNQLVPQYAVRVQGRWVTIPVPVLKGQGECDYLRLRVDEAGVPWLAWQAGTGGDYNIFSASLSPETGAFSTEALTANGHTHNLFPEILLQPDPVILWYTSRDGAFYLVGERYDRVAGQWTVAELPGLDALPADPLPHLLEMSNGKLVALWYERTLRSDGKLSPYDRILMGMQGVETEGMGVPIDQLPGRSNRSVSGGASDLVIAAWCADGDPNGPQVQVSIGTDPSDMTAPLQLSDNEANYYSSPKVGMYSGGAAVVWNSSKRDGGNGQIYFRDLAYK